MQPQNQKQKDIKPTNNLKRLSCDMPRSPTLLAKIRQLNSVNSTQNFQTLLALVACLMGLEAMPTTMMMVPKSAAKKRSCSWNWRNAMKTWMRLRRSSIPYNLQSSWARRLRLKGVGRSSQVLCLCRMSSWVFVHHWWTLTATQVEQRGTTHTLSLKATRVRDLGPLFCFDSGEGEWWRRSP